MRLGRGRERGREGEEGTGVKLSDDDENEGGRKWRGCVGGVGVGVGREADAGRGTLRQHNEKIVNGKSESLTGATA